MVCVHPTMRQLATPVAWSVRRARGRGVRELVLFGGAYLLYDGARWMSAGDPGRAGIDARWIVALERSAHVAIEGSIQRACAGGIASWLLANVYLIAQLAVTPAALLWLHRRSPRLYSELRNTVLVTWLIAVPVFAVSRVAASTCGDRHRRHRQPTRTGLADRRLDPVLQPVHRRPQPARRIRARDRDRRGRRAPDPVEQGAGAAVAAAGDPRRPRHGQPLPVRRCRGTSHGRRRVLRAAIGEVAAAVALLARGRARAGGPKRAMSRPLMQQSDNFIPTSISADPGTQTLRDHPAVLNPTPRCRSAVTRSLGAWGWRRRSGFRDPVGCRSRSFRRAPRRGP